MVLIVNTTSNHSVTAELKKVTISKGINAEIIETDTMHISHCIGCNHCWLKTPGV